jgi:hypothetical protein
MPSPTYDQLLNAIEPFLGKAKAEQAILRQLARCSATPDSLNAVQLKQIIHFVSGATKIHLAGHKDKQEKLEAELRRFG